MVTFTVHGKAKPAGSKRAFPVKSKNGGQRNVIVDTSGHQGKLWRNAIQDRAMEQMGTRDLILAPVTLVVIFDIARPKSHYASDGVTVKRAYQDARHTSRPDVTKLVRAIEDALTGIVWKDDAQVCVQYIEKRYAATDAARICILEPGDPLLQLEL